MKNLILIVFLLSSLLSFAQDNDGDEFTITMGDCNNINNTVFPRATEIPNNGIDEDYDGSDDTTLSV